MSQWEADYAVPITGPAALAIHQGRYGLAWPGYTYTVHPWPPEPTPTLWWTVTMIPVAALYRLALTYLTAPADANLAVTTHEWMWVGDGDPETADFVAIEAKHLAFEDAIKQYHPAGTQLSTMRWYELADDGSGAHDAAFRSTYPEVVVGTGTGMLPPQISCSVTQVNVVRRRWGRFYEPFLISTTTLNGRFGLSFMDTIADAAQVLCSPIEGEWMRITYSSKIPYALPTESVRVDNIPDVIRSRRWSAPTGREVRPIPAP